MTNNAIDVFRTCFGIPPLIRTGYPKFYKLMIDRVEFLTADGAPDEQLALATWLGDGSWSKKLVIDSLFFVLHGFTGARCFLGLSSNETSLGSNERIPWYGVVSKHQSYLPGLVPFCEEAGTGPGYGLNSHCIHLISSSHD